MSESYREFLELLTPQSISQLKSELIYTTNITTIKKYYKEEDESKCILVKTYNMRKLSIDNFESVNREINILQKLNNPNIIYYFNSYEINDTINIILEFAIYGDLVDFKKKKIILSEHLVQYIVRQIIYGLTYLHQLGYIHRDIKPENILVSYNNSIKIGDFGLSIHNTEKLIASVGTLEFMAPELILIKSYPKTNLENNVNYYDERIDIWALGILLYELLHKNTPFYDIKISTVCNNILYNEIHIDSHISTITKSFIYFLLNKDYKDRPFINLINLHKWYNYNFIDHKKLKKVSSCPKNSTVVNNNISRRYSLIKQSKINPLDIEDISSNLPSGKLSELKSILKKTMPKTILKYINDLDRHKLCNTESIIEFSVPKKITIVEADINTLYKPTSIKIIKKKSFKQKVLLLIKKCVLFFK